MAGENAVEMAVAKLGFGGSVRVTFYTLMRDSIRDGIPVFEALREIENGSKQLRLFPAQVIGDILAAMRGKRSQGPKTLGEALRPWADPVEATLIDAGEQSAKLDVGLNEAANLVQLKNRMKATVIGQMTYPVVLVLMLTGFLWMISSELIPVMQDIQPRVKWPALAKVLGWIADHSTWISAGLLGSIIGIGVAFFISAPRWTGDLRDKFDRWVPPWTIFRKVQSAMVLNALAMLMDAGIPVSSGVSQLGAIGSPWQRMHMDRIQARMRRGKSDSEAIAGEPGEGMFDPITGWEIKMYGSRSNFAESMKGLSLRSTDRVEKAIKSAFGWIRNILMVLVTVMLGMTFSSFMQITMSMSQRPPM